MSSIVRVLKRNFCLESANTLSIFQQNVFVLDIRLWPTQACFQQCNSVPIEELQSPQTLLTLPTPHKVNNTALRFNESIFHRINRRTLCALSVFENKVERNGIIVATDAYQRIVVIIEVGECELVSKKSGVFVCRLRVYLTV